jgi:hypothetical protein
MEWNQNRQSYVAGDDLSSVYDRFGQFFCEERIIILTKRDERFVTVAG